MRSELVVGFDLDLTLADSARGIGAVYARLAAEYDVDIDVDLVTSRLGPPLAVELAHWLPAELIPAAIERYRALYESVATPLTTALAGAHLSIDAVRAHGGRVVLVTAKKASTAEPTLAKLGFAVDRVYGEVWAEEKGTALLAAGAQLFVGDHEGDMRGARSAGAYGVGVTTGPCDADTLYAAGADVVLPDLVGFPEFFAGWYADWSSADRRPENTAAGD